MDECSPVQQKRNEREMRFMSARKSDPLSGPAQVYLSMEIDLASTVIPVLMLVLFLATSRINSAIQNVSKPGHAVELAFHGGL